MSPDRARLIQEDLPRDALYGWRMLVACCLLNRTRGAQVREMLGRLFELWPTPRKMAAAGQELEEFVRPLGLVWSRGESLRAISWEVGVRKKRPPFRVRGVGRYALDSWSIFVDGRRDVRPRDKELRRYLEEKPLEDFHRWLDREMPAWRAKNGGGPQYHMMRKAWMASRRSR